MLDDREPWQKEFAALPIRIGRNALNDCLVRQNYVSDFHARVEEVNGVICVRDLGSKNGVYLLRTAGAEPTRVQAQVPIDITHSGPGNTFLLGPVLKARIQIIENAAPESLRAAKFGGTVLGNQSLLSSTPPPNPGPLPPGSPYASPPFQPGPPGVQGRPPSQAPYPGTGPQQPWSGPGGLPNLPPVGALPPLAGGPAVGGTPIGGMPPQGWPQASSGPPGMHHGGPPGLHHGAPPAPPIGMSTAHFNLSPEMLALVGLRELAGSLVPGQPLETTGDIARLITKMHDAIEVFCRCFIPLREGYAQFVSSMDLQRAAMERSRHRSQGYVRVERSQNPSEVAMALLDWRDNSLDAPTAIEGIFADLMVHQVALLDGVMRGVRALLDQLAPENIEREVGQERGALGFAIGRHKALWEAYSQRFEELSEERQAFSHIFGPEFTAAYREKKMRRSEPPSY